MGVKSSKSKKKEEKAPEEKSSGAASPKTRKPRILEQFVINKNAPAQGKCNSAVSFRGEVYQLECEDRRVKMPEFKHDEDRKAFIAYLVTQGFVEYIKTDQEGKEQEPKTDKVHIYTLQHPDITFPGRGETQETEYVSDILDDNGKPRKVRINNGIAKTTYRDIADEMKFKGFILLSVKDAEE